MKFVDKGARDVYDLIPTIFFPKENISFREGKIE